MKSGRIEKSLERKSIAASSFFNLIIVVLVFMALYSNTQNIAAAFYYSLVSLGFAATITILYWIHWTIKRVKDTRTALLISLSMLFTLLIIIMIVWQAVTILRVFL